MSLSTANQFLADFGNLRVLDGIMVREPLAFAVAPDAYRLKFWLDNWRELRTADNSLPEADKYWYSTDWKKEHRSEEHTSELQSLMRISYDVFCWKTKIK